MTDPTPFGTALHDRVRDEHLDLDELVRASTRAGTRIRRIRRTGAALASAAGVAAVAVGVVALQGADGTSGQRPPLASDPPAPSTAPPTSTQGGTPQPTTGRTPVRVVADGWVCDEPADEKYLCHRGSAFVAVNWRSAGERRYYLDPDKADVLPGVHTFVSQAHGPWFATVAPSEGTTQAEVDEVAAGLVWGD